MKRAAISLTLSTVVLVILSIVIIALGLVLIRTVFTQMTTKVNEAIEAFEVSNPPTRDNPVTITPPELALRQGYNGKSVIAFLNVLPDRADCKLSHTTTTSGIGLSPEVLYNQGCFFMEKDQINAWTVVVTTEAAELGTTIFTMEMTCYNSKDKICSGTIAGTYTHDLTITVKE